MSPTLAGDPQASRRPGRMLSRQSAAERRRASSATGSSWAGNALADWVAAVKAQGVTVDYTPDGSLGPHELRPGPVADFAVSEIPYDRRHRRPAGHPEPPNFSYAMLPVVAGGTSFMYNLPVGGKRFDGPQALAGRARQDLLRPGSLAGTTRSSRRQSRRALPDQRITVVVRSDGSGATAQFTLWMLRQFPKDYAALCAETGCIPSSATLVLSRPGPVQLHGAVAVERCDDLHRQHAVHDQLRRVLLCAAAWGSRSPRSRTRPASTRCPTDNAVAVALTQAQINQDKACPNYLSQDLSKVYSYRTRGPTRSRPTPTCSSRPNARQLHGGQGRDARLLQRIRRSARASGRWARSATRRCP